MIKHINHLFLWSSLNKVGQSRTLTSSYIWIIVIPVLVRFLSKIEHVFTFKFFGTSISLDMSLPFSWEILYFSAILFGLGNLLYTAFCPELVSRYDTLSDFQNEGKTGTQLIEYMTGTFSPGIPEETDRMPVSPALTHFMKSYTGRSNKSGGIDVLPDRFADAFWSARTAHDTLLTPIRLVTGLLYGSGFILIGILVIQNFRYVLEYLRYFT